MLTHPLVRRATERARGFHERVRQEVGRRQELRRFRTTGRALAARRGEADHLAALEAEAERSRQADRADWTEVALWMLPVVALRGLATRAVLRHRIGRGHHDLRERYEALGRGELLDAGLPDHGPGFPGPPHLAHSKAQVEAARFGRAFWTQLRPAILPKAPALAGLAVGWWIANSYTDSRWKSHARSLGIGSGGTTVVSGETYRAMHFWLPLLAAALCAYLGDRLATAWRQSSEQ